MVDVHVYSLSLSLFPPSLSISLSLDLVVIFILYYVITSFPAFDNLFFLSSLSPLPADPLPDPLANFSLASSSANEGMFDDVISSKLKKLQNL